MMIVSSPINNTIDNKIMIDLSTSKRMGAACSLNNVNTIHMNNMNMNVSAIPDPTPMKELVEENRPHRVSFLRRDVVSTRIDATTSCSEIKRKIKTVRFEQNIPTKATIIIPSEILSPSRLLILTEEYCKELWYQKAELSVIKKVAKAIIARRDNKDKRNDNRNDYNNYNNNNDDNYNDGLERFTRQRSTWKRSSIHYILQAQKQYNTHHACKNICNNAYKSANDRAREEYIRNVSIRCSNWAKETALKQGFEDYCSIHDPLASLFTIRDKGNKKEEGQQKQKQEQHYDELIFGNTRKEKKISKKRKAIAVDDDINSDDKEKSSTHIYKDCRVKR